ncbi:MAG: tetratricopeptide repeat protein [Nitrincola lacisaponensis]|uniref:tetratricopeptide repeat protein n=1 Tax=Nitrincola lacisaponensis TaxID=267850 RepID=UPI00391A3E9A
MKVKTLRRSALPLLIALALSGCADKDKSVQNYLESGREFLAQGDIGRSNVQFRNVLQIDPDNVDAHRYLAEIAEREQNWERLYARLVRIERLEPEDLDVKVRMARLLLMVGEVDNAEEKADEVLAVDDARADAWLVKSTIALQKGDPQGALTEGMKSLMLDPENTDTLTVLAGAHRMMGDEARAFALLDEALEIDPSALAARMIRMELNRQNQQMEQVEADLRYMYNAQPDSEDFAIALAGLLRETERLQEAEALLNEYALNYPGSSRAVRGLVEVVDAQGETQRADSLLQAFIDNAAADDEAALQFVLIERLMAHGQQAEALQVLERLMSAEQSMTRQRAKARRAELYFAAEDDEAGLAQLSEILQEDSQSEPALLVRSRYFIQEGRIDDAVRDLRVVLRNNPDSEMGLMLLGSAYMGSGSAQLADSNFRQVLRLNPGNIDAAVPVINRLLADGDLGRSEQILLNALRRSPNNESLLSLLAQVRLMRNDWTGTEAIISDMQALEGNRAVSEYLSGRIFQGQGQFALAMTRYEAALQQEPRFQRAVEGYAVSQLELEQPDLLLEWLEQRISADPEYIGNYAVKAGVLRQMDDLDAAISVIDDALNAVPQWVQGYVQLAGLYQLQDQVDSALSVYARGIEQVDDLSLYALKASLLEQNGRIGEAIENYEAAHQLAPTNLVVTNNLAALLTSYDPSEENVRRALELTRNFRNSDEPYFLDTHGWALFLFGEVQEAERLIRRAVEGLPDLAVVNYHYGRVLLAQNRVNDARAYLSKAAELAEDDPQLLDRVTEAMGQLDSATAAN